MRLDPGEFLGRQLRSHTSGGFTLTQYEYSGQSDLPTHEHSCAYLSFPLTGAYEESYTGKMQLCSAGRAVFHPRGESHSDRFAAIGATIFSIEMEDVWLGRLRDLGFREERFDFASPHTMRRARALARLMAASDASPLRADAGAIDILADLPSRMEERRPPPWLRRVLDCLDQSPARPDLSMLASLAGVHAVHLARVFRRTQGCTIGEYFRNVRIERAVLLLREQRRPLSDVALACGFSDQSHFCREFKRAFGVTPAAFRMHC